jgi:HSP20 family protein
MPIDDKSRQQSAYAPSAAGQQGGGVRDSSAAQRRSLAPRHNTWLSGRDYDASPFGVMRRLSDDMDRLFENFGFGNLGGRGAWPAGLGGGPSMWAPHIEMYERDQKVVVQADLPGLSKEDVKAQIEDDAIILSGERKHEAQRNEGGAYLSERSYGSFYRVVPLPEGADSANASASFRDGVLRIEVPMTQRQRGRTLAISDGATGSMASTETATQQQGGGVSSKQPGSAT